VKITIEDIANSINKYCKEYKYFWAYGLIKETIKLWDNNKYLLCDTAQILVERHKNNLE